MKASFEAIQAEIAAMLDIPEDQLTPEQLSAMESYIDELGSAEAAKVDGFAEFLKEQAARADHFRSESQRFSSKARSAENRIAYLKNRYASIMQEHKLSKVPGNSYTLSLRPSESVGVTALIDDLPAQFVRVKVAKEPDKAAIKAALKMGQEIPGCTLVEIVSLQVS